MQMLLWVVWGIMCAFGVRVAVVRLLGSRIGPFGFLVAYPVGVVLFALGLLIVEVTGFQIYGYEHSDPVQALGYGTFIWSPLGMPLLLGAPFVIAYDLIEGVIGLMKTRRKAS